MTKKEMEKLLMEEYGYSKGDLRNEKGNPLTNKVLEELIEKEKASNTDADLKDEAKEEIKKEPVAKAEEETVDIFDIDETIFKPSHNLKDDDLVLCMSGVSGDLNFTSPLSGFRAKTTEFGQTLKIPYRDLVYVRNVSMGAFEKGQIIVLNKAVQEEFGLTDLYKFVITPKNVREVINMDADELSNFISSMPESMKATLYSEARKMYKTGSLDSVHTIRVLEDEFGISFEDNAPLDGKV